MKNKLIIIIFALVTSFTFAQQAAEVKVIEPSRYKKEIRKNRVQLIDVRTPEEFTAGHIKGAKNIDFFSEDFSEAFEKLDKDKPVYIYCRSGNRSAKAAEKLSNMGFSTIVDLKGGYKAWTSRKKK